MAPALGMGYTPSSQICARGIYESAVHGLSPLALRQACASPPVAHAIISAIIPPPMQAFIPSHGTQPRHLSHPYLRLCTGSVRASATLRIELELSRRTCGSLKEFA